MSEARHRTADEDQQRHRQELAAVVVKHLVGAGRTQEIDERADEAQDRDFDQRNDEADRHQNGEIRPDLPAIAPVIAEQARWRRAVIVIAKRIDAGLEETEHGLVSTGNRGQSRIRKRRRAPRQKAARRPAKREKGYGYECGLSRGRLSVRSRSAQQKERVAANAARIRRRSASWVPTESRLRRIEIIPAPSSSRCTDRAGLIILARARQIHELAAEVSS